MKLGELNIADGSIQGIRSSSGSLVVHFRDWQEKEWLVTFRDVLAFQSLGAENEDIAEVKIVDEDDFLELVKGTEAEADLQNMQCTLFKSAWNEIPLLKVIASSCDVSSKEN